MEAFKPISCKVLAVRIAYEIKMFCNKDKNQQNASLKIDCWNSVLQKDVVCLLTTWFGWQVIL